MQQASRIEPFAYGPDVGHEPLLGEDSHALRGVSTANEVSSAQLADDEFAVIVGPGRVLFVLLGWHLLLGLAFAAGMMLS